MEFLQNLPSRGLVPDEGGTGVVQLAPNYVALHSTEPDYCVPQDTTNPLIRSLKLKKIGRTTAKKRKPAGQPMMPGSDVHKPKKSSPAEPPDANKVYGNIELGLMTINQLKEVLRAHHAPVSGRKGELLRRIKALQEQRQQQNQRQLDPHRLLVQQAAEQRVGLPPAQAAADALSDDDMETI